MDADLGRLVGEERERLVERQQVRGKLAEIGEEHRPDRPGCPTVSHFVEIVRVHDDELPVAQREHVELDQIDADGMSRAKRRECVLRSDRRRPAVADQERSPLPSLERDHGAGRVGR